MNKLRIDLSTVLYIPIFLKIGGWNKYQFPQRVSKEMRTSHLIACTQSSESYSLTKNIFVCMSFLYEPFKLSDICLLYWKLAGISLNPTFCACKWKFSVFLKEPGLWKYPDHIALHLHLGHLNVLSQAGPILSSVTLVDLSVMTKPAVVAVYLFIDLFILKGMPVLDPMQ